MELFDAIIGRRSIRTFEARAVEEEKIKKVLEAAIHAPSAGNIQPWHFIVVKGKETKEKIYAAALEQESVLQAPAVIVVCVDTQKSFSAYGERGKNLYCIQDCANATMLLMLSAYSLGLGSVWVGAFNEEDVHKILKLPKNVRPMAIIPLGYTLRFPPMPKRLSLEETVHEEKF